MSQLPPPSIPLRQILGPIDCPVGASGDVNRRFLEFQESLKYRHRSVMRSHSAVAPDALPFPWEPVEWFGKGHRLLGKETRPSKSLFYAAGDYFLQDAASLLAIALCVAGRDTLEGKTVCDLCAAPGGKASALLEAVGGTGFLLANEPIRSRIPALRYNLARTGSDRYAVSSMDPEQLIRYVHGRFDCVLVDAPCSGQALFARGKQTEAAFSPKQIDHSARRQERILDAAIQLLKPGGKLVYSTCTFAHAENESQVSRLVREFAMVPHRVTNHPPALPYLTSSNLDVIASMETEPGCYRVWPHVHGSAGSFAAALTLGEETAPDESQDSKEFPGEIKALSKRKRTSRRTRRPVSKLPPELIEFFDESALGQCQLLTGETNVFGFAENAPDWVQAHVEHGFSITGPEIAYRTGKTWKPSHEASLRRQGCRLANKVMPLTENQAINFVAGLPVQFESGSAGTHDQITPDRRGWVVAQYRERPLGWVKCSSREGKNHLPPAIRMIGIEKSRPSA